MATAADRLDHWIDTLAEPGWMVDRRRSAARLAAESALPHWDRTDAGSLGLAAAPPSGGRVEVRLPAGAAAKGVVCDRIAALAASQPDLVARYLARIVGADAGIFEARNAAAHQGCLLYVPDGVALSEPVEIVYHLDAGSGSAFDPRTVVVLGRTAEATVVQREEGGPQAPGSAVVTAVVEADVGPGAQLRFVDLQDWGDGVRAYTARQAHLGRDARVQWLIGELGGAMLRSGTTTALLEAGGEALSLLAFFAAGTQHMDLLTTLRHHGPRTNGNMLAKGVLAGHGRAIYRGTSRIDRGAKDSNSQQRENVLHLNAGVRSDAIPALYINENQLQAGHAATTGKVDEEQMFYMAARGLPRREAQRLIVHGFFAPLLELLPLEPVRERLRLLIDRKIDSGGDPAVD